MRTVHSSHLWLSLVAGTLLVSSGCGPATHPAFSVPPPVTPEAASVTESEPPEILPTLPVDGAPPFLKASIEEAGYTAATTALLRRAEEHFEAGKNLLAQDNAAAARREFDLAIDTLLDAPQDAWDRYRVKEKCEELVQAIYGQEVEGAESSRPARYEESPLDDVLAVTFPVDPNIEMDVRTELKLPVSELPLEVNEAVLRYIRYFQTPKGREVLVEGLQRQGRYRNMIRRILDEEGIPQELIFLGQAESGFKPRALSRKRATGMWQFMRLRAAEYGLHRTRDYDDRLDPEKATRAAARHLRDLYEQLGDWYLAMAAYNAGPGRVDRAVRSTGYADFWELYYRRALPRETRNYVPIILAMILVAKNPAEYGLEDVAPDPPVEYNTVTMDARTHLGLVADVLGLSLDEIRELNPAILRDIAPAGYSVHVPKGTANLVIAGLDAVPAERRDSWRMHRVGFGETLDVLAEIYRTSPESIALANGGAMADPKVGDLVVIPVSYAVKIHRPVQSPVSD